MRLINRLSRYLIIVNDIFLLNLSQQEVAADGTGYGHSAVVVGQNDRQTDVHAQGESQLRPLLSGVLAPGRVQLVAEAEDAGRLRHSF